MDENEISKYFNPRKKDRTLILSTYDFKTPFV